MNKKSFVEKSEIDKKLCLHCEHCVVYAGLGMKDRIMCNLYKDKVDDSEIYYAWQSRYIPWRCGGRKWKLSPDIISCASKEEAENLSSEDWIENWMPFARKIVNGEKKLFATCGGLDSAIERVKKEKL